MCGLSGWINISPKKSPYPQGIARSLFQGIASRGKDAAGYLSLTMNDKTVLYRPVKQSGDISEVEKHGAFLQMASLSTHALLCHTRQSTGGDPKKEENNHPIVCGNTFVMHNGTISNNKEIIVSLKLSDQTMPEVDTFAFAALIDKNVNEGQGLVEAVHSAMKECSGTIRCVVWNTKFPTQILVSSSDGHAFDIGYLKESGLFMYASDADTIWKTAEELEPDIFGIFPAITVKSMGQKTLVIDFIKNTIEQCGKPETKPHAIECYGTHQWSNARQTWGRDLWEHNVTDILSWRDDWGGDWSQDIDDSLKWTKYPAIYTDLKKHIGKVMGSMRAKRNVISSCLEKFRAKMFPVERTSSGKGFYAGTINRVELNSIIRPDLWYYQLFDTIKAQELWNPEKETMFIPVIHPNKRPIVIVEAFTQIQPNLYVHS